MRAHRCQGGCSGSPTTQWNLVQESSHGCPASTPRHPRPFRIGQPAETGQWQLGAKAAERGYPFIRTFRGGRIIAPARQRANLVVDGRGHFAGVGQPGERVVLADRTRRARDAGDAAGRRRAVLRGRRETSAKAVVSCGSREPNRWIMARTTMPGSGFLKIRTTVWASAPRSAAPPHRRAVYAVHLGYDEALAGVGRAMRSGRGGAPAETDRRRRAGLSGAARARRRGGRALRPSACPSFRVDRDRRSASRAGGRHRRWSPGRPGADRTGDWRPCPKWRYVGTTMGSVTGAVHFRTAIREIECPVRKAARLNTLRQFFLMLNLSAGPHRRPITDS